jgi:hypothetical protein
MNTKTKNEKDATASALKRFVIWLKCRLFGHKYYLIKPLSSQTDLVGCERCKKKFGMNHSIRVLLPWDRELEKFYEEFYGLTGGALDK